MPNATSTLPDRLILPAMASPRASSDMVREPGPDDSASLRRKTFSIDQNNQAPNFQKGAQLSKRGEYYAVVCGGSAYVVAVLLATSFHEEVAARVRHGGRRSHDPQQEPVERLANRADQRWEATAHVEKRMTGKADGWAREPPKKFTAATKEEVLGKRAEFIDTFLHAQQRAPATIKRTATATDAPPVARRARRVSAPLKFSEGTADGRRGPLPGEGRAGPGRGHTLELTAPVAVLEQPRMPPPAGVDSANWLRQLSLKKQWQTAYTKQLKDQLDEVLKRNATLNRCAALTSPDFAPTAYVRAAQIIPPNAPPLRCAARGTGRLRRSAKRSSSLRTVCGRRARRSSRAETLATRSRRRLTRPSSKSRTAGTRSLASDTRTNRSETSSTATSASCWTARAR